jgi:hypothetical protein
VWLKNLSYICPMKNYNTLEGLERYYITDHTNKQTEASSIYGQDVWYFKSIKIRKSFSAFAMVNTKTNEYLLRCDPCDDQEYEVYHKFCQDYNNPEWVVLS